MITILGKEFPLYGILCSAGIALAAIVGFFLANKREKSKMDFFDFVLFGIYILVGSLVGSKLLAIVVSWDLIMATVDRFGLSWQLLSDLLASGWVFYGGFIGGAIALILYTRVYKKSLKAYCDFVAVVIPLGHGFGRIGCFLGGCCYGIEYDGWLSYTYKTAPLNPLTPVGVPLFPVQLVEAFFLFVLFGVLLFFFLKKKPSFDCWLVYFAGYVVLRFVLEFFRGDKERGMYLISTSQWISIALFLVAVGIFVWKTYKGMYKEQPVAEVVAEAEAVEEGATEPVDDEEKE